MKQSRILTIILVSISALVAGGLILIACRFVDSLHENLQATKDIHIHGDTKVPERGRFDAISGQFSKQIDSMSTAKPLIIAPDLNILSGSEIIYAKGLEASNADRYQEGSVAFSQVLRLLPAETKTRSAWLADGKNRDQKRYLSMTYERRAFCYLHLAQYKSAISDLNKSIALRPDYGPNYVNRGKAYKLIGEPTLGEADLKHATTLPVESKEEARKPTTLDEIISGH